MNARIHPAVAALVIALTLLAVGLWIWAGDKSRSLGGPAELMVDAGGRLFVQIHNQLLEHDQAGAFVARHDLARLGTDQVIGGMDFFADGDLLFRRGVDTRSVMDNIRAFRRETNRDTLVPEAPDAGLFRCDLKTSRCEPFGDPPPDPKSAFGVLVDDATGNVYLSDTSRHVLRKYAADGAALAGPADGFRFPNGLALVDGRLYVADTNHHRVAIVAPATDGFGHLVDAVNVVPDAARAAGHQWPSHLARVGEGWWVNNMDTAMQYGGIYRFDADWRYAGRVELPDGADPIDILPFDDEVLISDWLNDRIYRVSPEGRLLGTFTSPGIEAALGTYREQRFRYRLAAWSGVAVAGIVLLVVILHAVVAGTAAMPKAAASAPDTAPAPDAGPCWLHADRDAIDRFRRELRLMLLAVGVIAAILVANAVIESRQPAFALLILPFIGLVAVGRFLGRFIARHGETAIGLHGDELILRDARGRESRARLRDVIYTQAMIATPDMAVFLGRQRLKAYKPDDVAAVLMPRLAAAEEVSPWRMQRHVATLQRTPPQLAILLLLIAAAAVAALLLVKPG